MRKTRVLAGAVLTAGLGLTGVVSATASGASPQSSADNSGHAITVPAHGHDHVPAIICLRDDDTVPAGKSGAHRKSGAHGKSGAQGRSGAHAKPGAHGKSTVKVVGGKVYVDGKLVPASRVTTDCPVLPGFPVPTLPTHGKGGKGSVTICIVKGSGPVIGLPGKPWKPAKPGAHETGTAEVVKGKAYVNDKPDYGVKLKHCPELPPLPTHGKGGKGAGWVVSGTTNTKGAGWTVSGASGVSAGGTSVKGGPASGFEAGVAVAAGRG